MVARVVVPFIKGGLRPETTNAVDSTTIWPEYIELDDTDPHAYAHLLISLWENGNGFSVVEQDVVPGPGQIAELWDCPQPWCSLFVPFRGELFATSLCCTKFTAELTTELPTVARYALSPGPYNTEWITWKHCDGRLANTLQRYGKAPHGHMPPPEHLNPDYRTED